MKLNLSFIILLLIISSCCQDKSKFIIKNNSKFDIDSLSIFPDSKNQYYKLLIGESLTLNTCMNKVKSDGSYLLSFKNMTNGKMIKEGFGYYTNGSQIEKKIIISIHDNEVKYDSDFYLDYKN